MSPTEYVLRGPSGAQLTVLDVGATVTSYRLKADDPTSEVVVGFDDEAQRQAASSAYFGAVVGRYANRIAGGQFILDSVAHRLETNEGSTTLHGGPDGISFRTWEALEVGNESLVLGTTSPDGDQGFPGELVVQATYQMLENGFSLELCATTSRPTPVCLTSHLYLNLAGKGSIDDHVLKIPADRFVPIDPQSIPLSAPLPVQGTPFDFRRGAPIGERVREGHVQIATAHGIDHSFDIAGEGLRTVAEVRDPSSGRCLQLRADAPALQVYTGNYLDGGWIARTGRLRQGDALALEPHVHPDSPNQEWAGDVILRPGEQYRTRMEWRFAESHSPVPESIVRA